MLPRVPLLSSFTSFVFFISAAALAISTGLNTNNYSLNSFITKPYNYPNNGVSYFIGPFRAGIDYRFASVGENVNKGVESDGIDHDCRFAVKDVRGLYLDGVKLAECSQFNAFRYLLVAASFFGFLASFLLLGFTLACRETVGFKVFPLIAGCISSVCALASFLLIYFYHYSRYDSSYQWGLPFWLLVGAFPVSIIATAFHGVIAFTRIGEGEEELEMPPMNKV